MIISLDASATWTEVPTPDSAAIYDITFPDSLHGYAVGDDGVVLKYIPPVIPVVPPLPVQTDDGITCQLFPNPLVSGSRFKVQSSMRGFITLKVFGQIGNEVATIFSGEFQCGKQLIYFDGKDLPAGIYLYQLRLDGVIRATGKIVVVH
jgi:hypothetical protein